MLYKRGKTYWIDITVGGHRIRRTAGTTDRKAAQELHAKLSEQAWRQDKLGEVKHSFEEAAVWWLKEKAGKKSIKSDAQRIEFWRDRCAGMLLNEISSSFIYEQVNGMKTCFGRDPSNATKNRYIALLVSILRRAVAIGWLDKAPVVQLFQENNRRKTYFTPEQARLLLAHLPDQHKAPVTLAFLTGLRKSNVYGLRWDQIDLKRGVAWVYSDEFKGGVNHTVPLNSDSKALLAGLLARRTSDNPLVFAGLSPILTKAWRRVVKQAGLPPGLRFHDTRHSFASWHIMAGTNTETLQALAGWSSPAMLKRYVHLADAHLVDASERLSGYIPVTAEPAQLASS